MISKTPKFRRRKDTRPGELIKAALAEFAEHGYGDARLSRIATRAGVSNGTLYHYFDDKEALFISVFEETFVSPLGPMDRDIASVDVDPLMSAIDQVLSDDLMSLVAILLFESARYPEPVGRIADQFLSIVENKLGKITKINRGAFAEDDFYPLGLIFYPVSVALLERARGKQDWAETARRVAHLHLRLLTVRPH